MLSWRLLHTLICMNVGTTFTVKLFIELSCHIRFLMLHKSWTFEEAFLYAVHIIVLRHSLSYHVASCDTFPCSKDKKFDYLIFLGVYIFSSFKNVVFSRFILFVRLLLLFGLFLFPPPSFLNCYLYILFSSLNVLNSYIRSFIYF